MCPLRTAHGGRKQSARSNAMNPADKVEEMDSIEPVRIPKRFWAQEFGSV